MSYRTSYRPSKADRPEALERLREWLRPGDTLHTILRHRASSGMTRWISVLKLEPTLQNEVEIGRPQVQVLDLDFNVAKVLGRSVSDRYEGVKCEGAGMDMGFDLVYSLSSALFPDGFGCIGEGCPSNDHTNGDRDYTLDSAVRPHWHSSGGYALRHRWL